MIWSRIMKNQAETTINVRVSVEVKRPTCEILCHKLRPKKTVKLGKIKNFHKIKKISDPPTLSFFKHLGLK